MSMFKKATKSSRKLRMAVYGLSGGGKTYSSLAIATGLGKKIAVIDTERHSSSLYSDRFDFDVCAVDNPEIDNYVKAIKEAGAAGYDVLIIDSLTHAWDELLTMIDKIASAKYRGNTWSAWQEGTPMQKKFVNAILDFPGHVIATIRSKTEWDTEKDKKSGKSRPIKVGLSPQQKSGLEYEFDLLGSIDIEHNLFIEKDRTGKFQDKIITKPGKEFGKELDAWFQDVPEPKTEESTENPPQAPMSMTGLSKPAPLSDEMEIVARSVDNCKTATELNKLWESFEGKYKGNSEVIAMFREQKKGLPA